MCRKSIMSIFNKLKEFILWLLLTKKCRYCNTLTAKNEDLCDDCKENLPRIKGKRCEYCGAGKDRCNCKKHHKSFDGITAPFYYENGVKHGLQLLKFNSRSHLAKAFAEDMAECVKRDFARIDFDFICYVPFSPLQITERSYNQSELLAEELSKRLEIPVKNALVKLFDVKTQHDMAIMQRKGNVHGIYDVKDGFDVKGKTVLLVDDIMTTGETLNNCALIMKIRGAEKVYCITAALTAKKKKK